MSSRAELWCTETKNQAGFHQPQGADLHRTIVSIMRLGIFCYPVLCSHSVLVTECVHNISVKALSYENTKWIESRGNAWYSCDSVDEPPHKVSAFFSFSRGIFNGGMPSSWTVSRNGTNHRDALHRQIGPETAWKVQTTEVLLVTQARATESINPSAVP